MTPPKTKFFSKRGFTIIELLTVIAVGAVLLAMIIPVASGARRQYAIAQTKALFNRATLALEQFKAEYGAYPQLGSSPININEAPERFLQLMTGRALDGSAASDPVAVAQNPRRLSFLNFAVDELTADGRLQDALGQTDILLYYDTDGDGFLNGLSNVRAVVGWQSSGPQGTFHSW